VDYDSANMYSRKDYSIFHCLSGKPNIPRQPYAARGYAYNYIISTAPGYGLQLSKIETPDTFVLMIDFGLGPSYDGKEDRVLDGLNDAPCVYVNNRAAYIAYRHSGRTNVLFADGHASSCEKGGAYSSTAWLPKGKRWINGGSIC